MKAIIVSTLFAAACGSSFGAAGWATDFQAAKRKAADEQKHLLVDFNGSDWCNWCQKLKKEVFDTPAFKKGTAGKFVLVDVDFPRDQTKLPQKLKDQNDTLRLRYGVRGYPTILFCDADGRPYGRTGYVPGGPAAFLQKIEALRGKLAARDKALAEAGRTIGKERAAALEQVLMNVPEESILTAYRPEFDQLAKLAPKSKVITTIRAREEMARLRKEFAPMFEKREFAKAVAHAEKLLAKGKPTGTDRQRLLMFKLNAEMAGGDQAAATKTADAIEAIDAQSEFGKNVNRLRSAIDRMKPREAASPSKKPADKAPPAPPETGRNERPGKKAGARGQATLSDEALRKALVAARGDLAKVTDRLAQQHRQWEHLDTRLQSMRDDLARLENDLREKKKEITTQEKSIDTLQKEHDRAHAAEIAAKKAIAAHEREVQRRAEIARLQEEARQLQRRAETLRKQAEGLKKE